MTKAEQIIRIKEQLISLENNTIISTKDKLIISNFYKSKLREYGTEDLPNQSS